MMKKSEDSLQDLQDSIKRTNVHIKGVPGGEKGRDKWKENLFEEMMARNFPNLRKEIDIQIHEAKKVPNKMSPRRPTPGHIIINVSKVKGELLKAETNKSPTCNV